MKYWLNLVVAVGIAAFLVYEERRGMTLKQVAVTMAFLAFVWTIIMFYLGL